ncbi:MAG: transglutaminase-like cysteine peptidase [Hyphomicrobiaceae bacterium]
MWQALVARIVATGLVLGAASVAGPAAADPGKAFRGQDRASPYMRIFGSTLPPYGFVRFCESYPAECVAGRADEARMQAGAARMSELDAINRHVNRTIIATSDLELYGETERWVIPKTHGDCEDYALLKRQLLMARGWPASALLMTVVRDEKGEGHAVLTARTAQGDFILDNKVDDIKAWHKVPYAYVMRQSYIDPRVWVSLDPKDAKPPVLLSGVQNGG